MDTWKARGHAPVVIECTTNLIYFMMDLATLERRAAGTSVPHDSLLLQRAALRSRGALTIIRFVNLLTDQLQTRAHAVPGKRINMY